MEARMGKPSGFSEHTQCVLSLLLILGSSAKIAFAAPCYARSWPNLLDSSPPENRLKDGDQWDITEKGLAHCSLQRNMAILI